MHVLRLLRRHSRVTVGLLALGVGVGLTLPATGAIAAQRTPAMTSQTPAPVRDGAAHELGATNSSQTIRLAIGLKLPDNAALQQFLTQLQDKASPEFHHYLTPAQFTARFGPSAAAQQAVVSWAAHNGLTVDHLYSNHLVVDVSGSVGNVEHALGVQINNYRLGNSSFFANDRDPVLPAGLSNVVESVDGLSSLQTMYPTSPGLHEPSSPAYVAGPTIANGPAGGGGGSHAKLVAAQRASKVSGSRANAGKARAGTNKSNITGGAYDPTDIYSSQAYNYNGLYRFSHCCNPTGNPGGSPAQTSIAVATFGSQNPSDFQGFHNQYPYLAWHYDEIYIDGTPACCDAEGTMDFEWSTAMSNSFGAEANTSEVYLYDGANFNDSTFTDIYNAMVNDNLARVFSTSWSCTEFYGCSAATMTTRDAIFSEMAAQGWTLVAASGDRGAYDDCSHLAVSYPASDPNVVGAGGTDLQLGSGPTFESETAWSGGPDGCGSNDGGSGGGCSSMFAAPSFQSNEPCGAGSRAVPDISLNADWFHAPQNFFFGGGLSGNGGTSIVAPELAGFFAQEDSYLLSLGNVCGSGSPCGTIGNANYPIYESALDFTPHNPFYDITSGCNSNNVGSGYCAGPGYDLVTGWGSANMMQLAWAFNWHLLPDDGRPVVTYSGPATNHWYNSDQTVGISVADTGGGEPASGVAGFSDAWNVDPGDPTTEPHPGTGNSFYNGPEFTGTSGTLDLAAEGQGCHTVNVESWDNMGFQSGDVTDGPLCYDTVAPTVTKAPLVRLQNHVGPISTSVPVTVSWAATDATSGVNHYTLYRSLNGGAFSLVGTYTTTSTTRQLTPGDSYRYEVSATDNAGNTSAFSAGPTYKITAYQENSSAIKYTTGWTRQAVSGAYGGDVDYATANGKTATLSFNGFQAAWVSTEASNRGSATVKLDSGSATTINTNSSSTHAAQIVDVVTTTTAAHKLVVDVLGTSGHPRVDVDAFLVLST